jgi:hypothetical protein
MFRQLRWLLTTLLLASPVLAADVRFDGSYRLRFDDFSNLTLDDTNFNTNQKTYFEHRLRLTPKIVEIGEEGGIEIQASFDIFSGILAGDTAPNFRGYGLTNLSERDGFSATGFSFRHLFTQIRFPLGVLQVGQMPSQWGMGMVANNGEGENTSDFSDSRYGDIVDRLLFATRPLQGLLGPRSELGRSLAIAIAGDVVFNDRYAQLVVSNGGGLQWGDTAVEAVGAIIYDPSERTRAGLYISRRVQNYALDGGDLHVWIYDAHLRHARTFGSVVVSLEGEAAEIWGGTSHSANLSAPGTTTVSQQGAVLRLNAASGAFEGEIEGGYASGDSNPFDNQSNGFMMNRDFKVGMVLFDQVMMFQSQNAARRLSEPALSARPPKGLDLIATEGAVTNALYWKPTVRWKPAFWRGSFKLVASALFAYAPEPYIDAYQAFVNSAPANSYGARAGRDYGIEIDGAAGYSAHLADTIGFETGIQAGYLFTGDAFDRADGTRMPGQKAIRLRATLTF